MKDSVTEEQELHELRARWQRPDRWAQLDDEQLERLTFFACVHYGRAVLDVHDPRFIAEAHVSRATAQRQPRTGTNLTFRNTHATPAPSSQRRLASN
jgi:hypothetical protein